MIDFLYRLRQGEPWQPAIETSFGVSLEQLDAIIQRELGIGGQP